MAKGAANAKADGAGLTVDGANAHLHMTVLMTDGQLTNHSHDVVGNVTGNVNGNVTGTVVTRNFNNRFSRRYKFILYRC